MKPVHTIVQEQPLIVHINKAGRAVHQSVAAAYVKKMWPGKTWFFKKADHSVIAEESAAALENAARALLSALNWKDAVYIEGDIEKITYATNTVNRARDNLASYVGKHE